MTRDKLVHVDITTVEQFEAVLAEAVERATLEGVDVRGAWEFTTRGSEHHWDVEIVELDRDADEE